MDPPAVRKPGKDPIHGQREYTAPHSRIRIRVENSIQRTKIFRIAKEQYRNDRNKCGHIINNIVCGVVNRAILLKRAGVL